MFEFAHSPLGGSAAKRFLNCGASFLLQRLLVEHGEYEELSGSSYADLGTAAHTLGALCLEEGKEPYEYTGEKFGDFVVHPEDLDPEAVAVYVNHCNSLMYAEATVKDPSATVVIEKTFHLHEAHPLFKGTADFALWRLDIDPILEVIDYKNGEGIGVSPFQNPQLMYYAGLLILGTPELRKLPSSFPVNLGIVQPNYWGSFEEPEVWNTTIGVVHKFITEELLPAMRRLSEDTRDMIPVEEFISGEHCLFCPVMLDCPKLRKAYETFALADEFIEMLSDKELSDLFTMREEARLYANMVEKTVLARKLAGRDIASAKLVEKRTRRIWKAGAEAAAKQQFGDKAYDPPKIKSPAKLEKLSSTAKAFAEEYAFKADSDRLTIAPLSDKRAEAKPVGNAEVFKNFAEDAVDPAAW